MLLNKTQEETEILFMKTCMGKGEENAFPFKDGSGEPKTLKGRPF